MERTIYINEQAVPLKATGSTLRRYRALFNRDLIADFNTVKKAYDNNGDVTGEIIDIIQNMAYVMAKQKDNTLPDVEEWLDSFDTFDVGEIAADVANLWAESMTTKAEAKKA